MSDQAPNRLGKLTTSKSSLRYARRRRQFGPVILLSVLVVLMACGILAFFLFRNSPAPTAGPPVKTPSQVLVAMPDVSHYDQAGIQRAVTRGVAYLKQEVLSKAALYYRSELADVAPGNAHLGALALAGLTLLECDVAPDDSAVQLAAQTIRAHA